MDFIELIFALLAKFVPLDSVKLTRLENDGKKWYNEIDPADEDQNQIVRKIKIFGEMWYSQVAMAISFIFLQRIIFDFLNPTGDDDEDDD
ncbi:MAG: hypothetical protein EOO37_00065 [Cytophagaceae bacterium]|nr:MAG: hypothetical protein EOO37_00065 [Cytophagaceae bacterium]